MPSSIAIPLSPGTDPGRTSAWSVDVIAFGGILALVLFRVLLTPFERTELSTDEAQYWFWGQNMALGAYSKPPLIGWILRLATDLLGQEVWAVRLPAALFHGATAIVIYLFARRIAPGSVAALASALYVTTPAVALGSAVMTTDTPMLLAAAVALLAQARLAETHVTGRRHAGWAIALGLALGLGLLAKHAMLFWIGGALAATLISPAWRIARADAFLAAAVFAAAITPHLVWLAGQGFVTLHHIQDITQSEGPSFLRPLQFLAEQLIVMGPVVFAAMVLAIGQGDRSRWTAGLSVLALAPLLIIVLQAARGSVLANWAVLYLVPGSVLAALWLARHPRLAALSLTVGLVVSLALPLFKVVGAGIPGQDGQPLLKRYLGHSEVAVWALDTAEAAGARTLVATERDLLADLSWFGANRGLAIRAVPPQGRPAHHWEMTVPFDPADPEPVFLLVREHRSQPCPGASEVGRLTAGPGFAGGETLILFRLADPACLSTKGAEG